MTCLIIALFHKRSNVWRSNFNNIGLYYSSAYLLWGVIVKLTILSNSNEYFAQNGIKSKNAMVTPMPLTSFYWMILAEDEKNFYIGYKSLFYTFQTAEIDTIPKNRELIENLKWQDKNYSKQLEFIANGYYTAEQIGDTIRFYDLRFGLSSQMTNRVLKHPVKGYGMVIDNGIVQKTLRNNPTGLFKELNFNAYFHKIFSND
jgi:inner membrane protein